MGNEIALNCLLNSAVVPAAAEPRLVYLLVDIKPGGGAGAEPLQALQAPVNMAVVLDVSESMRLPVLSQEQFEELRKLGEVYQSTSDGVPVWTFRSIPEHIRKQAPSNVEAVQTSISQAARHFEAHDRISLVAFADRASILLSGVPGTETNRVLEAVAALGSAQLGDETEIGVGLEAGLNEVHRGQTPGMVNRALILTDGFTREPKKVLALARGARNAGIAVSTLGIGTEFNEKLLVDVADASLGNAYFARTPQEIPPAFGQELAAVQAVTLRDVQVDIKLSAGVEMRRAYRVRPAIASVPDSKKGGRVKTVPVGDMDPANPPAVLVELLVPTQQGGTFRVAQVTVTFSGSGGERVTAGASDVVLKYSMAKIREQPNPVVMNIVERVTAYVLQTRALNDVETGNTVGATQKLRAAATRLLNVGEVELAQTVEAEAARLEQSGEVSPEAAKEMRYATRRLTQRLDS